MKVFAFLLLLGIAELGNSAKFVYKAEQPKSNGDDECAICRLTVVELQTLLKSTAMQTELRTVAEYVCNMLPTELQSTCHTYVDTYYDKAIQYLLQHDATGLCKELDMCASGYLSRLVKPISANRVDVRSLVREFAERQAVNDECSTCKAFFTAFEQYVTSPQFINTLITYVSNDVCPHLEKEFPDCKDFAARYVPMFFSLLQQISPNALCGFFGLCSSQAVPAVQSTVSVKDDCADCQTFVADAQKLLSDPNEQQKVTDLVVNKLCPMLGTVFPQCATYAQEYLPIGISMFLSTSASSICQGIGWCTSMESHPGKLFHKLAELVKGHAHDAVSDATPSNDMCSDCETFITDAQKRYSDPKQQQIIIDLVANQACPLIANVFPACADYAKEYIPVGFQYLQSFTPEQICKAIDFCTSSSVSVLASPWMKIAAAMQVGDSCSDCEQFMADAQHFYADQQNQQQVIDMFTNQLCPVLSTVFPECAQFAKTEIPAFFVTFESLAPVTLCTYTGLCSSLRSAKKPAARKVRGEDSQVQASKSNDQTCSDCQVFFADLTKYYTDPNHQQAVIDELVQQVCPLLTQQFPECAQVLPEYLPIAFQAFVSLSPNLICSQLHFCTASPYTVATLLSNLDVRNLLTRLQSFTATKSSPSACTDCDLVVVLIRGAVKSNETVEKVVELLSTPCNYVAEAGRPMCFAMLRAMGLELLYTFNQSSNQKVCATFFPQCAASVNVARTAVQGL